MAENSEPKMQMSMNPKIEKDREAIMAARKKGKGALFGTFLKLSGPGWLQSAITLGGGSLASSLYLGVLVGFSFLWLQPLAMILGIIMLSAISYVTLSTGQRPLRAINEHVSPVLGWSWVIASMMANIVWSMPQFALGTAAIRQNLLPGIFGADAAMGDLTAKVIVGLILLAIAITFVMLYNAGGKGVRAFEIMIKLMVGMIVLCFFGVVVKLAASDVFSGTEILKGLIPNPQLFFRPAETLMPFINGVGEQFQGFWTEVIVAEQRGVMISAASTAVGINMTFLLPYSMLRKGWGREFRGLAIFDLSTGLFIPFIITTGCVVIASAGQFHAKTADGFLGEMDTNGKLVVPGEKLVKSFNGLMDRRIIAEIGADEFAALTPEQRDEMVEALPLADRKMGALLVRRDAFDLADTIAPLTGEGVAKIVFGVGVLGMALGAITMLMLINGLVLCEMLNKPATGWPQKIGSLMVSVGVVMPFIWKDALMWLAIPTSMFAMVLLPIAYISFTMLMNQKKLLGDDLPKGGKRIVWNILMACAVAGTTFLCMWTLWSKFRWFGVAILIGFIV
ncbi:MAG: divalent metal cation transporter, partial [Anaerohalosphaera sp.]|nr:divalent metal cation transporter [Anaerohalosphaera sp.]